MSRPSPVTIEVLGPLRVLVDGSVRRLSPRLRWLTVELAFAHPLAVPVEALLSADPGMGRASVQTAVWRLRKLLGHDLVVSDGDSYRLREGTEVDLDDFERAVEKGWAAFDEGELASCARDLDDALARWRGAPDPVLATERGAARRSAALEQRSAVTERWGRALVGLGRPGEPVDALRELTRAEPLREEAWATLIEAHRALGEQTLAAATAVEAVEVLSAAGVRPSRELAAASRLPGASDARRAADVPLWLATGRDRRSFVERHDELEAIAATLRGAARSETSVAILAGEAGVGKTRLVAEAARMASGRGFTVWAGRWDRHESSPMRGVIEALEALLATAPAEQAGTAMRGVLGQFLRGGTPAGATEEAGELHADQLDLFNEVGDLLAAVTAGRPGLLVLDDLHWASWAELVLLRHVLRVHPAMKLCILASYRTSDPVPASRRAMVDELIREPGVSWLELAGLTPRGVASMPEVASVAHELGEDPRTLADWTVEVTGGNALFIDRLLEAPDFVAALRSGAPQDRDQPNRPARLRAVLASHVAALDPASRHVLAVAALLAPDVDRELLGRVADVSAAEAIGVARASGLLAGEGRWLHFAHGLVATELAASLPEQDRWRAHLRIADELEARAATGRPADRYAIAHHLGQAGGLAPSSRVCAAAVAAGRDAARQFDFGLAARSFATAAQHADPADLVDMLVRAVEMTILDGDASAAEHLLAEADHAARAGVSAADLARVAVASGDVAVRLHGRPTAAAGELAREALARSGTDLDPTLAAELELLVALNDQRPATLSAAVASIPDPARRVTFARRGIELGHMASEPALQQLLADSGTADGEALGAVWAWIHGIQDASLRFDDAGRAAALDAALDAAGDAGWAPWACRAWEATRLLARGRFDDAEVAAGRAARLGRAGGDLRFTMRALVAQRMHQVGISFHTGRPGLIGRDVVAIDPTWTRGAHGTWQWDAFRLAWSGDRAAAREVLALACERAMERPGFGGGWLMQLAILASSAFAVSDRRSAERLLAELVSWSGHHAVRPDGYLGPVEHSVGLLLSVLGDVDGAVDAFRSAADAAEALGARTFHVLGRMQLVLHLRGRGGVDDLAEADKVLPDVLADAAALGMARVTALLTG